MEGSSEDKHLPTRPSHRCKIAQGAKCKLLISQFPSKKTPHVFAPNPPQRSTISTPPTFFIVGAGGVAGSFHSL
eukprot:3703477-Amphidinium_carterae.1